MALGLNGSCTKRSASSCLRIVSTVSNRTAQDQTVLVPSLAVFTGSSRGHLVLEAHIAFDAALGRDRSGAVGPQQPTNALFPATSAVDPQLALVKEGALGAAGA
jgi:hypothetical protein